MFGALEVSCSGYDRVSVLRVVFGTNASRNYRGAVIKGLSGGW